MIDEIDSDGTKPPNDIKKEVKASVLRKCLNHISLKKPVNA